MFLILSEIDRYKRLVYATIQDNLILARLFKKVMNYVLNKPKKHFLGE
jgi:hypothetical protein